MGPLVSQDRVSAGAYLASERAGTTKHELWRGEVFAMAGASYTHNRIVANLLAALRDGLASGSCVALPSDMKVRVPSREAFVHPDASIVCDPPEFFDASRDVLTNPAAVFDVLSESTERFDRGAKFVGYRSIASLCECMFIAQHERRCEHYTRRPDGSWVLQEYAGDGTITLACGGTLALGSLYHDSGA